MSVLRLMRAGVQPKDNYTKNVDMSVLERRLFTFMMDVL